jgi:hypothetical protein
MLSVLPIHPHERIEICAAEFARNPLIGQRQINDDA